jgi:predicted RNA-binding Zn ribbon-like protein
MSRPRFFFLGQRLAIDLVNTVVMRDGALRDLLAPAGAAEAWARAAGIAAPGLRLDAAELRMLREGLRRGLVAWGASGTPSPRLIALVNRYLAGDAEALRLEPAGESVVIRRHSQGTPTHRVYGAIARSAAEMLVTDDPRRLRKCASPDCVLMFYDVSKAGRRRWCSMLTDGARAKARAFRRRAGVQRRAANRSPKA